MIWQRLIRRLFLEAYISIIKDCTTNLTTSVREEIQIDVGLRQSLALSPLLFIISDIKRL